MTYDDTDVQEYLVKYAGEFHGYTPESHEEVDFLRAYDPSKYAVQTMTVDLIVYAHHPLGTAVLLIKRKNWPFKGKWALPGGFINPDEKAEAAAIRECHEEAGLKIARVSFAQVADAPHRDPRGRVFSMVFTAQMWVNELSEANPYAGDDAVEAAWFHVNDLAGMDLAFDHGQILENQFTRKAYKSEVAFV